MLLEEPISLLNSMQKEQSIKAVELQQNYK
jgi:hypothetical protein